MEGTGQNIIGRIGVQEGFLSARGVGQEGAPSICVQHSRGPLCASLLLALFCISALLHAFFKLAYQNFFCNPICVMQAQAPPPSTQHGAPAQSARGPEAGDDNQQEDAQLNEDVAGEETAAQRAMKRSASVASSSPSIVAAQRDFRAMAAAAASTRPLSAAQRMVPAGAWGPSALAGKMAGYDMGLFRERLRSMQVRL